MLLTGALALTTPKFADAQIAEKINPFRQPNQAKEIIWDNLSTKEQRESLLSQYLSEDKTDTITFRPGFNSGNFSTQLNLNFYGSGGFVFNPADTSFKYDLTNLEKFNIPLYYTSVSFSSGGHGLNAILVGDNPQDFSSWSFVEPQTDQIVQPGSQSMPSNSNVKIKNLKWVTNSTREEQTFLTFNIASGNPSLVSYDTARLVLERNFAPENFSLVSPSDGAIIDSCNDPMTFSWEKSVDRDAKDSVVYIPKIRNKNTGVEIALSETRDTSLTLSPRTLTKGNYEWFAYSTDSKETAFSDTADFTIKNTPPTPSVFTSPADKDTIKYDSGKFKPECALSTDADNDTINYLFKIKRIDKPGLDTSIVSKSNSIAIDSSILKPGSKYSLEGKVFDNEDTTDFSKKIEFFTPVASSPPVNTLPTQSKFIVPSESDTAKFSNGKFIIKYHSSKDDKDSMLYKIHLYSKDKSLDTTFLTPDTSIAVDSSMFKPGSENTLEGKTIAGKDTVDFSNKVKFYTPTITSVTNIGKPAMPENSSLSQNFPNPFNPSTRIKYSLKEKEKVSLKVYDLLGREVETLVEGEFPAGEYQTEFSGSKYSSGVYFYRLQAGDFVQVKKMVLSK